MKHFADLLNLPASRSLFSTASHADPGLIVSLAANHLIEHSKLPAYLAYHSAQLVREREATLRLLKSIQSFASLALLGSQDAKNTAFTIDSDPANEPRSNPRSPRHKTAPGVSTTVLRKTFRTI